MYGKALLLAAWQADKKLLVLIPALLLLNVVGLAGLRSYVQPQIADLERRYIERQAEIRQLRAEGRSTQQAPQDELWQAQDDLQIFWQAVPARAQFTALIGELFELAEAADLAIDQVSYEPKPHESQPVLRYGLGFSVVGDYGQIKHFIHALEQSERLIAIESIALSSGGDPGEGQVSLNLRLATLFRSGGE